jgi:hypothetical protein
MCCRSGCRRAWPRACCWRTASPLDARLADLPDAQLRKLGAAINRWTITPNGSEGYRKAEVTRGGIDTRELSQQSMMANKVPGLYFIGEAVDVTGWLGGYNFQWAWASGVRPDRRSDIIRFPEVSGVERLSSTPRCFCTKAASMAVQMAKRLPFCLQNLL